MVLGAIISVIGGRVLIIIWIEFVVEYLLIGFVIVRKKCLGFIVV